MLAISDYLQAARARARRGDPRLAVARRGPPPRCAQRRGPFTGARAEGNAGKFELAHRGTLFLDEVDSMPPSVQAKILRAVETKRVARLNGRRELTVDVRIIAAGNRSRRSIASLAILITFTGFSVAAS